MQNMTQEYKVDIARKTTVCPSWMTQMLATDAFLSTKLRYKVGPRLRELAPAARGGQEARSRNLGPAL